MFFPTFNGTTSAPTFLQNVNFLTQNKIFWLFPDLEELFSLTLSWPVATLCSIKPNISYYISCALPHHPPPPPPILPAHFDQVETINIFARQQISQMCYLPDGGPDMDAVQTAPQMMDKDNHSIFLEQAAYWLAATDIKLHQQLIYWELRMILKPLEPGHQHVRLRWCIVRAGPGQRSTV